MSTLVRISVSEINNINNGRNMYDLSVEGLSKDNARVLSTTANNLLFGGQNRPFGDVEDPLNPIEKLSVIAQNAALIAARLYYDRHSDKIATIKFMRYMYKGLGLKDAKDFVEYAMSCSMSTKPMEINVYPMGGVTKPDWLKF